MAAFTFFQGAAGSGGLIVYWIYLRLNSNGSTVGGT